MLIIISIAVVLIFSLLFYTNQLHTLLKSLYYVLSKRLHIKLTQAIITKP